MTSSPFVSYAPNGEDVVLVRLLQWSPPGTYVEVVTDPRRSVTRALSDKGWSGVLLTTDDRAGETRPHDTVVATAAEIPSSFTADVVAADSAAAAAGIIAATGSAPRCVLYPAQSGTVEGYTVCVVLGETAVCVPDARVDADGTVLSVPPSSLDGYVSADLAEARLERDEALAALQRWRAIALSHWPEATPDSSDHLRAAVDELSREIVAIRSTVSWRVTRPLRGLRLLISRR